MGDLTPSYGIFDLTTTLMETANLKLESSVRNLPDEHFLNLWELTDELGIDLRNELSMGELNSLRQRYEPSLLTLSKFLDIKLPPYGLVK